MRSGAARPSRRRCTGRPPPNSISSLHVTGRRADGYHELQTLFQLIDLCRRPHAPRARRTARSSGRQDPPASSLQADLTVRAARALKAATGIPLGANIQVRKRIPLGGGLGGGSSDAATVLLALNELWGCGLDAGRAGARLGCPSARMCLFSLEVLRPGGRGWASELDPGRAPGAVVCGRFTPGSRCSTAAVFQSPELTRNSPLITIRAFFESGGRNDCEAVVRSLFPEVARRMSGSGASRRRA